MYTLGLGRQLNQINSCYSILDLTFHMYVLYKAVLSRCAWNSQCKRGQCSKIETGEERKDVMVLERDGDMFDEPNQILAWLKCTSEKKLSQTKRITDKTHL